MDCDPGRHGPRIRSRSAAVNTMETDTARVSVEVELPGWLDTLAFQHSLDLSKVLEQALLEKLDIR